MCCGKSLWSPKQSSYGYLQGPFRGALESSENSLSDPPTVPRSTVVRHRRGSMGLGLYSGPRFDGTVRASTHGASADAMAPWNPQTNRNTWWLTHGCSMLFQHGLLGILYMACLAGTGGVPSVSFWLGLGKRRCVHQRQRWCPRRMHCSYLVATEAAVGAPFGCQASGRRPARRVGKRM